MGRDGIWARRVKEEEDAEGKEEEERDEVFLRRAHFLLGLEFRELIWRIHRSLSSYNSSKSSVWGGNGVVWLNVKI